MTPFETQLLRRLARVETLLIEITRSQLTLEAVMAANPQEIVARLNAVAGRLNDAEASVKNVLMELVSELQALAAQGDLSAVEEALAAVEAEAGEIAAAAVRPTVEPTA